MPTNRWIYMGVLLIIASVLLWIGAELTRRIEWFLPYSGGLGVLSVIIGVGIELWRKKSPSPPSKS